jgi:large-conductance mechanosensitive channel
MAKTKTNTYAAQETTISKLENDICTYAAVQGRQNALNGNSPRTVEEFKINIINYIDAKVQETQAHNHQLHIPVSEKVIAENVKKEATLEIQRLQPMLNDREHKKEQLREQKKLLRQSPRKWFWSKISGIISIVTALCESTLPYDGLRTKFNTTIAIYSCIAIGISIYLFIHLFAHHIKNGATRLIRNLYFLTAMVLPAIGLYSLSNLRANAANGKIDLSIPTTDGFVVLAPNVSVLDITIISFLIYGAALFLAVHVAKTKEEEEKMKGYKNACRELKECNKETKELEKKRDAIAENAQGQEAQAMVTYERAVATKKRIDAIANKALQIYISTNMRFRSDGQCPNFFSDSPPFSFS